MARHGRRGKAGTSRDQCRNSQEERSQGRRSRESRSQETRKIRSGKTELETRRALRGGTPIGGSGVLERDSTATGREPDEEDRERDQNNAATWEAERSSPPRFWRSVANPGV
ncbi:hypothetical protein NDU88_006234 [Pleurodeles waltl]|uniref:Uncharacterized protein n=1 Tax=Pleurodeles waltl TaxID=8319 RepID=A0AAV7NTU3_PLEWA|nr:hypothetical protein NDU88_006234 [Pleurodeles waltl]